MRTTLNIRNILLSLLTLTAVSCSDNFLDVPVQGGENTSADPNLALKLVTGVYSGLLLGDSWGDNGDVHGFAFISVTNIISDDADKGSTAGDQLVPVGDIDDFNTTSTNKFAETLWSGHYSAIGNANQALKALKTASLDAATIEQLEAQVKFLRGYLYFNLVRMYGGVPLVYRVPADAEDANSDPAFKTRAAVDVVYDSIKADLQYAADHLPLKVAASGLVTKGTAQSMLAKVYLYRKDWDNVWALTNEVMTSGKYGLLDDYAEIWRQSGDNSVESIFESETGVFNNSYLRVDNYTICQGPRIGGSGGWNDLGWGFNNPSANLVNAYEPGDVRKDATIIFIDNSGTHKGTVLWDGYRVPSSDSVQNLYYNYKAYTSTLRESFIQPADKDRPKNIRILRYADVLLMNAEAAVHLGKDAATPLNMVRKRAKLPDIGAPTEADIWKERRVELAMEHDRFWDLVRQGRAAQVMHAVGKTNFVEGKNELLPIPNSQILLSGGALEQNFGY